MHFMIPINADLSFQGLTEAGNKYMIINAHIKICSYLNNIFCMEGIQMKKSYKIDVDCAACAEKMQEAAKKLEFVDAAILRDEMLRLQAEIE